MGKMEKTFLVFTCIFKWNYINALFSVKVPESSYTVQIGTTVDLECNFPVIDTLRIKDLTITWLWRKSPETDQQEVYVFHNGKEDISKQDSRYKGRATLVKDTLFTGRVVLQISNIRLSDRGTYQCLIGYGGADYRHIDLLVEDEIDHTLWPNKRGYYGVILAGSLIVTIMLITVGLSQIYGWCGIKKFGDHCTKAIKR
ncbi:programmed cell death 1 ligand 1-like isoform X3 [Pleurodeles waltl]|uniref:programmed cell death 1 ligand 1-like isoform X3 n=1 Tax=Pleurodeles waltl TaxID=8319 RepID=UPI00370998B4